MFTQTTSGTENYYQCNKKWWPCVCNAYIMYFSLFMSEVSIEYTGVSDNILLLGYLYNYKLTIHAYFSMYA